MNGLRAENTAHTTSIAAFDAASLASEAQSSVQRENIIADKTLIEELKRKCDMNDDDCGQLRAELDVAARTLVPRIDGERPEIIMLIDLNQRMISKSQAMAQDYAQAKRELKDQETEASN
eukprot:10472940-Heterocapsa_arctica.AAC.1